MRHANRLRARPGVGGATVVSLAGLLLAWPGVSHALERLLTLEPAATEIRFTLGATLHQVEGSVRLERGELRFDPETGAAAGEIVVDATSAETGNERRDRDMHAKVLESERHPRFVFAPSRLEGELSPSGASRLELHGELEIHGSTHPLVLPTEVEVDGDRLTATGRFSVPYVEWGMKDPSKLMLRVEKQVEVEISATGRLR